jgi:hypothetical protein
MGTETRRGGGQRLGGAQKTRERESETQRERDRDQVVMGGRKHTRRTKTQREGNKNSEGDRDSEEETHPEKEDRNCFPVHSHDPHQ